MKFNILKTSKLVFNILTFEVRKQVNVETSVSSTRESIYHSKSVILLLTAFRVNEMQLD